MGEQKPKTSFSAYAVFEILKGTGLFVLVEETAEHKKGLLNLPGGREDPYDLTLSRTAAREGKEETGGGGSNDPDDGLDIQIDGLLDVYPHDRRPNGRIVVFSGFVIGGVMKPTLEHPSVNAYSIEEVDEFNESGRLRDPRVHHAIHAYVVGTAIPISSLATQQIREREVRQL